MIHFNELYITEDGKNLVIDAEIDNFPEYKDCYLERITVDTTKHCEEPGLFAEPLVVWEAELKSVGELDDDGKFTRKDLGLYKRLIAMTDIWDITATEHNKRIYVRDDGTMYYNGFLIDEYGDYSYDEQGEMKSGEVTVDEKLYSLYKYAVYNYDDPIDTSKSTQTQTAVDHNTPLLSKKFVPFIADQFTDLSIYPIIFGVENTTGKPGDVNNDNAINIADINKIITSLENYVENISEGTAEEIITGQEQHVRLCLDALDLTQLIGSKGNLSDHMFVVKVEAVMVDKDGSIAKMGCGWDTATIYGAAYNSYPIYRGFLDMMDTSGSGDACNNFDMENMSDYILNYYAFDFALRMGDWCTAWKYWNELNGSTTGTGVMIGGRCGCHGPY